MVSMMLVVDNERERQILKTAFEQRGVRVVVSAPKFHNWVMALQYLPDILLIELPRMPVDQLNFVGLMRKHKKTRGVPILGYGNEEAAGILKGFQQKGVNRYFARPLSFAALVRAVDDLLRPHQKQVETSAPRSDKEKDIELILNSEAKPRQKIEAMCRHVEKLLAFPFTIAKVLHITQDPKSGAAQLARAIQADPAITANLLKVSNSVFFATSGRRIDSVQDAIVRIGFLETKKIAMTMTVMRLFDEKKKSLGFDRVDFWYHSIAAGLAAEQAARHMGGLGPEAAFLAGLLHDLGLIILDDFFPGIFDQALDDTVKCGGLFIDRETALLGVNHNDMLAELFETWKIPREISDGIVDQYRVHLFRDNLDTDGKRLALCVAIGNTVAKVLHIGRECDEYVLPLDNWVFESARIPAGLSAGMIDALHQGVDMYRQFLGLEQREYPREFHGIADPGEMRVGILNPSARIFVPPLHYLAKQGEQIISIRAGTPPRELDGAVNVILAWVDGRTSIDGILDYGNVVRYAKGPHPPDQPPPLAPILVAAPPDWQIPDTEQARRISVVPQEMDLRELDKAMAEALAGKVVRLPQPSRSGAYSGLSVPAKTTPGAEAVAGPSQEQSQAGPAKATRQPSASAR